MESSCTDLHRADADVSLDVRQRRHEYSDCTGDRDPAPNVLLHQAASRMALSTRVSTILIAGSTAAITGSVRPIRPSSSSPKSAGSQPTSRTRPKALWGGLSACGGLIARHRRSGLKSAAGL